MVAPRESPLRFTPKTVSDSIDDDNSPPGACSSLSNLLWDPSTPGVLLCRPANLELTTFPGFTSPGIVSGVFQQGQIIYGLIASGSPAGKDTPFAYNIFTSSFLTISGITSANTPTTPAATGDWTPPTADALGGRIYFTHPGFNFAGGYAFGYFDMSGFTANVVGDTVSGSPTINGAFSIAGIGPGYPISGTGIPANTTVINTTNVNISISGNTHSNTTIDGIASTAGLYVGQTVGGSGIATGTTIASIVSGTAITISQAATATATAVPLSIGGQTLTLSANATSTNNGSTFTISGGTAAAPLWCAGNTTGVLQLLSIPQAVKQFNNRLYFAAGNNLIYTDTLSANISNSNGVQVLTIDDSTNITALSGLPLYTTSGGVLAALIAFKGFSIWQITGDSATGAPVALAINQLSGSVGTVAPRSTAITPDGIYFMANDGCRQINLAGQVSEPDSDLALPFIYAVYPSRVAGAYNADIYRVCVQNTNTPGSPYEDYYYHRKYKSWSGPHTFRVDCAVPYQNDFIVFNNSIPASMWQAFTVQNQNAQGNTFVENGTQLYWTYQTAPITDTGNMYENCAVRSTLDIGFPAAGLALVFQGSDENGGVVAQANFTTPSIGSIWGAFVWGAASWGAQQFGLKPQIIPWTNPLIFNKLIFKATGQSALGLKLGSLYVGYQRLGYLGQ